MDEICSKQYGLSLSRLQTERVLDFPFPYGRLDS
jgi:hypothetical protein